MYDLRSPAYLFEIQLRPPAIEKLQRWIQGGSGGVAFPSKPGDPHLEVTDLKDNHPWRSLVGPLGSLSG